MERLHRIEFSVFKDFYTFSVLIPFVPFNPQIKHLKMTYFAMSARVLVG